MKFVDFIAMGRINVDFYPHEMNVPFNEIISFKKSIGGSPANIAVGAARLGVNTGFIGKVSDDVFGAYILDFFQKEMIDTSQIGIDKTGAVNCIAFTEVKSPENCSAIIYRDNVADLKIEPNDISEEYIKNAKILLISGTALSKSPSREAVFTALTYAKKHNTIIYFDLDYRANAWSVPDEATAYYQKAAEYCDVIIGTKEEMDILKNDYIKKVALVIVKQGKNGSVAYLKDGTIIKSPVFPVQIKKTYGAGDAYAAALIFGILQNWELQKCLKYAAAAASIVISRTACAESSPYLKEITDFISKGEWV